MVDPENSFRQLGLLAPENTLLKEGVDRVAETLGTLTQDERADLERALSNAVNLCAPALRDLKIQTKIRERLKRWQSPARVLQKLAMPFPAYTEADRAERDIYDEVIGRLQGAAQGANMLDTLQRLPGYIEDALTNIPETRGRPGKNFLPSIFLTQLWPVFQHLAGDTPKAGGGEYETITHRFAIAALALLDNREYSPDALRDLIRLSLGKK